MSIRPRSDHETGSDAPPEQPVPAPTPEAEAEADEPAASRPVGRPDAAAPEVARPGAPPDDAVVAPPDHAVVAPPEGAVVGDSEPLDVPMPAPDEPAGLDARTHAVDGGAEAGTDADEAAGDSQDVGHDDRGDDGLDEGDGAAEGDAVAPGVAAKLVAAASAFQDRWDLIQVDFVDDPRQAVERADGLVGDVVDEIVRALATEREQLGGAWRDDSEASTEDLRLAFQRYRTMFQRLLRT